MKIGHYSDRELPKSDTGYRCANWDPMPAGKKNVVVLGCSHTYGVGHSDETHWVAHVSKHNTQRLRYWNLGQPGASADKIVRILYGTEKLLDPKIIIVCWPLWSRRERLENHPISITSDHESLKVENENTDRNNFLKNVFFVEKFAEKNSCKTFHCFADESYHEHLTNLNVLPEHTIKNCWPVWDKHHAVGAKKELVTKYSLASDGIHYGIEHHERFAQLFLERFALKLK